MSIPAAQYLRMSTEHQNYSLLNQSAAIQQYAEQRGFLITRTYEDAGKSGLKLKNRPGLMQLLADVVNKPDYRAILVYDVSRWGRFQDVDEAAHYEFICKSAGVPVLYCAEHFGNEVTITNAILKGLKRAMAAEYSRELGDKSYFGQRRLVELGFKGGGTAPYGLRRFLISSDGKPKGILHHGECKAIHSDRVILVPGPAKEIATVRRVFQLLANDHWTIKQVARQLNAEGIPYPPGEKWTRDAVEHILRDPKYTGCNVWGRTSCRLKGRVKRIPKELWVMKAGAFEPIVPKKLFQDANDAVRSRYWSNERLLDGLRRVLAEEGAITQEILGRRMTGPKYGAIVAHFGSLQNALTKIGYQHVKNYQDARCKGAVTQKLQHGIVKKLAATYPNRLTVHKHRWGPRPYLKLDGETNVSVYICPCVETRTRVYWRFVPRPSERHNVSLCCLATPNNDYIAAMYLMRTGDISNARLNIKPGDPWFTSSLRLQDFRGFCAAVKRAVNAGLPDTKEVG
jgi:DNA invertase Pin-like site-specific DNA recombinase